MALVAPSHILKFQAPGMAIPPFVTYDVYLRVQSAREVGELVVLGGSAHVQDYSAVY